MPVERTVDTALALEGRGAGGFVAPSTRDVLTTAGRQGDATIVDFTGHMISTDRMSPKRSAADSNTTLLRVRPLPGRPQRGLLLGPGLNLPCALGRSGITRFKREGDGATPIARMAILSGHRRAERGPPVPAPVPLVPIRADDGWCDDVADGRYNRPVHLPVSSSHETLRRDDGLYDLVFVLDWNLRRRVIGRGSAIFLHCAKDTLEPTAGCIALRPADLRRLLPRLKRRTVLVVG